jgi:hypothetical protein
MNSLAMKFVLLAMLLTLSGGMEQVNAEPFLFSANPDDSTVTRIDLATGQSTVIMDAENGLTAPSELTIDRFGNLYVANAFSADILKLSTDGQTTVFVAGQGTLSSVHGLAFGPKGDLFIADGTSTSIYRFDIASGSLAFFGDVTTANQSFNLLEDIEFDHLGNLYAATGQNVQGLGAIVKFTSQGHASVFATGLQNPRDLAVDNLGHLYVANRIGEIVNRLDLATGSVQIFAELSQASGDPRGVRTDLDNNVYILNSNGDIRKWDSDGVGGNVEFHSGSSFSEALAFVATGNALALEALIAQARSIPSLNKGQKNSLIAKLEVAQRSLAGGNRKAATGQLGSFINQIHALARGGRLDTATADSLSAQAEAIINGL